MIRANKPFAALMPLATINQIDRISKEGIDKDIHTARLKMPTIISTALGYGWLINHPEFKLPAARHTVFFYIE